MARMLLVRTTVAKDAQARAIADALVGAGLAACVHVVPVRSSYVWKGRREDEGELLVEARVLPRHAKAAARRMREGHPYELPLIEVLKVTVGDDYAAWAKGR
jgi:periplasmic divalent cation tolerance protein